MRLLLPFLGVALLGGGYALGARRTRQALNEAYLATQPLLSATRQLLAESPGTPTHSAARALTQGALETYEARIRAL